jgi:hypothetical protein
MTVQSNTVSVLRRGKALGFTLRVYHDSESRTFAWEIAQNERQYGMERMLIVDKSDGFKTFPEATHYGVRAMGDLMDRLTVSPTPWQSVTSATLFEDIRQFLANRPDAGLHTLPLI